MKKLIAIPFVILGLTIAGCGESYTKINDTQVVVRDGGDKVDTHNIATACDRVFILPRRTIANVDISGDRKIAVVTCK